MSAKRNHSGNSNEVFKFNVTNTMLYSLDTNMRVKQKTKGGCIYLQCKLVNAKNERGVVCPIFKTTK